MSGRQDESATAQSNLLELVPRRAAEWAEDGGRVVLQLPEPEMGWRRPRAMLSYTLATKKIRLDEVGSLAWHEIDGHRTVAELAELVRERFGDTVEPVEERLGHLVRQLHHGGFISYADS